VVYMERSHCGNGRSCGKVASILNSVLIAKPQKARCFPWQSGYPERAHDAPNLEKCEPTIKSIVIFDTWIEGSLEADSCLQCN